MGRPFEREQINQAMLSCIIILIQVWGRHIVLSHSSINITEEFVMHSINIFVKCKVYFLKLCKKKQLSGC